MPTTNSTDHYLNWYKAGGDDNSSIAEWVCTNTGNQSRKKGLPILQTTYTLSSSKSDPVINARLLDWNDAIYLGGHEIRVKSNDIDVDLGQSPINPDAEYTVYGHPDKFVYDYQQKWNNCGVVSSLNILSMAGKKDIVELTSSYASYLSNPTVKTQTVIEWDEKTGSWVMEEKTVTTYPKAQTESEDAFLLWAVQNSHNDQKWYDDRFSSGYINTFTDTQKRAEVKDFCFHTLNAEEYLTIDDLYDVKYTEVGTTTYKHADNILEYWGVPAEVHYYTKDKDKYDADTLKEYNIDKTFDGIDILVKLQSDPGEEEVLIELQDAIDKFNAPSQVVDIIQNTNKYEYEAEQTINYNQYLTVKETITTINQEPKKEMTPGAGGVQLPGTETEEETTTYEVVEKEYATNLQKYSFLEQFDAYIKEGKGVILEGYANAFIGGKGGGHAITLTGIVWGEVTTKITEYYINDELKRTEGKSDRDIIGVYVLDTGGFLGNVEGSQFISCDMLYKFLTDTNYSDTFGLENTPWISGGKTDTFLNVTQENIRNWAENLNLTGNNRKNVLEGNEGNNIIKAGAGDDVLRGMGGNDSIQGDSGDDVIYGGEGNDILTGGTGNDVYMFEAAITEKKENEDGGYDIVQTAVNCGNDLINVGSGKDSIQFVNTIVVSDSEYNRLALALKEFEKNGTPVPKLSEITALESYKHTDIGEMYYQNRDGHLVIKYDTIVNKEGKTTTYSNSITINNYFKKNLYSSIKDIQTQTRIFKEGAENYLAYPDVIYNFVTEFIQKGYIDYFTEKDENNKIAGTKFKDYIFGGNQNDNLSAGASDDILYGGACNDTLKGGAGDDIIYASSGNDSIYGEAGVNNIYYQSKYESPFNEEINTNYGGNDTIVSGKGEDHIYLTDYTRGQLSYAKSGNNLVVTYNQTTGASITITNYFSKKGKTSVKDIVLKDNTGVDLVFEYNYINSIVNRGIVDNRSKSTANETINGNYGYDKLTGGKGNDSIVGGLGNDTLYGGNGNDILVGGLGADKMYGQAGDNTYQFAGKAQGSDIIYTTGKGTTTLDFTGSGLTFNEVGAAGCIDTYSYTKSKNDLIINYATNLQEDDNATVKISGFFTSKNNFILKDGTNSLNLKEDIAIYMEGNKEKKTKITGSVYNDSIVAYDYNDTLNGGKGNDTISGGKGNDAISGGAGDNVINYNKHVDAEGKVTYDGYDTITLTKNENLIINLNGFTTTDKLDFNIVKGNLIISTIDTTTGLKTDILNLKSFGTKDVTTANGSVLLNFNGNQIDLRTDAYFAPYTNFTAKKYSYTGNWHSEYIFADTLNYASVSKNRGAKINAGAGNDFIVGSFFNDTINGGDGNDTIYGDFGKNTIDGGKGSDKYYLFYADSEDNRQDSGYEISPEAKENSTEITTIKDTGKVAGDVDTVYIYDNVADVTYNGSWNYKDSGYIWFNTDKKGNTTFYIADANKNSATITGVEQIIANGGTDANTSNDFVYDYKDTTLVAKLQEEVAKWETTIGKNLDINSIMKGNAGIEARNALLLIFNEGWEQYQP